MIETDSFANRLIAPASASPQEEAVERALRPKKLAEYIGQQKIRGQFEIFIEGKVPGGHLMQTSSAAGITGELKVRLLHSALGMMTEIRELQEALEKRDWVNVGEEVGDVLWYWAVAMRALRIEHVAQVPPTKTWVRAETRTGRPLIEAICAWGDLVRRDAIHAKGMKPEDAAAALGPCGQRPRTATEPARSYTSNRSGGTDRRADREAEDDPLGRQQDVEREVVVDRQVVHRVENLQRRRQPVGGHDPERRDRPPHHEDRDGDERASDDAPPQGLRVAGTPTGGDPRKGRRRRRGQIRRRNRDPPLPRTRGRTARRERGRCRPDPRSPR